MSMNLATGGKRKEVLRVTESLVWEKDVSEADFQAKLERKIQRLCFSEFLSLAGPFAAWSCPPKSRLCKSLLYAVSLAVPHPQHRGRSVTWAPLLRPLKTLTQPSGSFPNWLAFPLKKGKLFDFSSLSVLFTFVLLYIQKTEQNKIREHLYVFVNSSVKQRRFKLHRTLSKSAHDADRPAWDQFKHITHPSRTMLCPLMQVHCPVSWERAVSTPKPQTAPCSSMFSYIRTSAGHGKWLYKNTDTHTTSSQGLPHFASCLLSSFSELL